MTLSRQVFFYFSVLFIFTSLPLHALDIGDTAPNWVLQDATGKRVDYHRDAEGKVSVLLYWATWCPYCRSLMPHLQELADEYKDDPVVFYAMNIREDGDPVKYLEENGMTFDLILNADPTMGAYAVRGTPTLYVVGPSHRVVYERLPDTPDEAVKAAVKQSIDNALEKR